MVWCEIMLIILAQHSKTSQNNFNFSVLDLRRYELDLSDSNCLNYSMHWPQFLITFHIDSATTVIAKYFPIANIMSEYHAVYMLPNKIADSGVAFFKRDLAIGDLVKRLGIQEMADSQAFGVCLHQLQQRKYNIFIGSWMQN